MSKCLVLNIRSKENLVEDFKNFYSALKSIRDVARLLDADSPLVDTVSRLHTASLNSNNEIGNIIIEIEGIEELDEKIGVLINTLTKLSGDGLEFNANIIELERKFSRRTGVEVVADAMIYMLRWLKKSSVTRRLKKAYKHERLKYGSTF